MQALDPNWWSNYWKDGSTTYQSLASKYDSCREKAEAAGLFNRRLLESHEGYAQRKLASVVEAGLFKCQS